MKQKYHVATGMLHNRIFAGRARVKERVLEWIEKEDVTDEAIYAVLDYFVQCAEKEMEETDKGMEFEFKHKEKGFVITISVMKVQEAMD